MKVTQSIITVFLHETENPERVLDALTNCLGLNKGDFSLDIYEGYHGNHILAYKAVLQKRKAEEFVEKLFRNMSKADIVFLISSLDERVERNRLHLRLDKQALIAECKTVLRDGDDVVKVILTFSGSANEIASELSEIAKSG